MPLAINRGTDAVSLRPGDAVRIEVSRVSGAIDGVELDLARRTDDTHCQVALPAMPNVFTDSDQGTRIWATARYESAESARVPFSLYVASYRGDRSVGEVPIRYFAGPDETSLVLDAPIAAEADWYQLVVYADRRYRGRLRIRDLHIVAGPNEYRIGPETHLVREAPLARQWRQEGRRLFCTSTYGEHWADMPPGWRLDRVHPAALAATEWILFNGVDRIAFGVNAGAPQPSEAEQRNSGNTTLLSFSLGTDSTAAMALLPEGTIRYYCQRPYTRYLTRSGAAIELPDPAPWEERLRRLDDVIVVPNTFELIQVAGGGRHGYAHNFGYAAIGLLLADDVGAGVLAFGSVMEQVFLRSGHLFADVVALDRSAFNSLRRLAATAGLFLALPAAGCSEVLTTRISDTGRYAGLAISCPRAAPDGTPCGTCFKCFRKLRLEGRPAVPEPDESVVHTFEKYPLKSATSLVYAAQRSAFRHPILDEYLDVDLGFLERYFDYAIQHMVPSHLREHIRAELASLGIEPMTEDDELRLRTIGQVFWPESFSWSRAGIAEPEAVS